MNIVISSPKTAKAYSKKMEKPVFLSKKIGSEVDLSILGLEGYTGKIVGGSDKDGFPMKSSLEGTFRRKVFISKGVGFNPKAKIEWKKKDKKKLRQKFIKGIRVRKNVRGNTVAEDIHQLNIVVVKEGSKPLDELFHRAAGGAEARAGGAEARAGGAEARAGGAEAKAEGKKK